MLPHPAQEKAHLPCHTSLGTLSTLHCHPHSSRQRERDQEGSNRVQMELLAALGCALLLPALLGQDCPSPCRCWSLPEPGAMPEPGGAMPEPGGAMPGPGPMPGPGAGMLLVDCSSRGLRSVPALPRRARSLRLHNNSLASIPAGALDGLQHLRHLQLGDNPWHCDCHILYLRLWLQDFSEPALAALRCASPAALRSKPLAQLSGAELGACSRLLPTQCLQFFWRDLLLIAGAVLTLLLAAWALKFSRKLVCQLTLGGRRPRRSIPRTRKTQ